MADINRRPEASSFHQVHSHTCPSCKRGYTCNCHRNEPNSWLVCIDCEHGNYDPTIHGGQGTRSEA